MFKKLFVNRTDHKLIQLIRYGAVTVIAGPIDLGGYILLKAELHIYYVLAATISFTVSLIVNYFLSIAWVWTAKSGRQRHIDTIAFVIVGVVGLGLTDLVVWVFTDFVGLNYIVSKLFAFAVVFSWSFGARRFMFQNNISDWLPTRKYRVS